MAEERLTVLMRSRGGKQAARDVEEVADATADLDKKTVALGKTFKRGNDRAGLFSRGLRLLQTRFAMMILLAGILTVALGPPLLGVIALLTAGSLALAGALAPLAILGIAIASRFSLMKEVAGSAAYELVSAFNLFKEVFAVAMAGPADTVMGALADALEVITPLIKELAPGFKVIGDAAAGGIALFADTLAGMGPQLNELFAQAGPFIEAMGPALAAFASAMVYLGIAGIPVLTQLTKWLTAFLFWLGPAIEDANEFARSPAFQSWVSGAWEVLVAVAEEVWTWLTSLAIIAYELYESLEPLLEIVGGGLVVAFDALGDALEFIADNPDVFVPLIVGVVAFVGALYLMAGAIAIASAAWALFLLVSGIAVIYLIVAAVIAFIAVLFVLYNRVEFVRDAIDWLWRAIKNVFEFIYNYSPLGWLIQKLGGVKGIVDKLKDAWGWLKTAIKDAVDFVRPYVRWIIDKWKWIIDHAGSVVDKVKDVAEWTPWGIAAKGVKAGVDAVRADGGPVHRGGGFLVGERGPELFLPNRDGQIVPNHDLGGPSEVVIPISTFLDGKVLAEAVHRQAVRKKSVR